MPRRNPLLKGAKPLTRRHITISNAENGFSIEVSVHKQDGNFEDRRFVAPSKGRMLSIVKSMVGEDNGQ